MSSPPHHQEQLHSAGAECHRPRRPAPDTVAYLRSLPLDRDAALQEIQAFCLARDNHEASSAEFPAILAAALQAIYEIRHEWASLAGEEHAAELLELLCHIAIPVSPTAARVVLEACKGYGLHLATHRYGSHVLQTLLELTAVSFNGMGPGEDLALHEQAPELLSDEGDGENILLHLPSLQELVLGLVEELQPAVSELAVHICGSHVLRSLLCCLGGVRIFASGAALQLRRGKLKNKKKKRKKTDENTATSSSHHGNTEQIVYLENAATTTIVDGPFARALQQLSTAFTTSEESDGSPGRLQRWACHSSAGPLLAVLLQVLTYQEQTDLDKAAIQKVQSQWQLANSSTPNRHVGLCRPEPRFAVGSQAHLVVQRILCWKQVDKNIQQPFAPDVIYGLAGEPRGSHLLETILRLAPDEVYGELLATGQLLNDSDASSSSTTLREYVQDDVSNFVVQTVLTTIRTPDQAAAMVEALEPFVASGFVLDRTQKRRGILWRLVELAASKTGRHCQEQVMRMIQTGFEALLLEKDNKKQQSSSKQQASSSQKKWTVYVANLLNLKRRSSSAEAGTGQIELDVPGTRTLYHLLRFASRWSETVVNGLLDLSSEDMDLLVRDALGSRCTIDPILEQQPNQKKDNPVRLLEKLQGRWVSLALDRVGHHAVTKIFFCLKDVSNKERLVLELASGKSRMNANSMGRSVLEALEVRAYESQGAAEWSKLVKKQHEREEWLNDMVNGNDKPNSSERKRTKRSEKEKKQVKKKGHGATTVDAILNAISIPGGT